jgi:hypothetical protein
MSSKAVPSRREFTKALAVLAAAAVPAAAQDDKKAPDEAAYSAAVETIIRFRFGSQLSEPQIGKVRAAYLRHLASARALSRVRLANGDDPIVAFRADLP